VETLGCSSGVTIPEEIDLEDVPMLEQTLEEWGQKLSRRVLMASSLEEWGLR